MRQFLFNNLWLARVLVSFALSAGSVSAAAGDRGIFNPDCFTNKDCSVVILRIPDNFYASEVTTADVNAIYEAEREAKMAWLRSQFPYQAIDFFFGITTLNEGLAQLKDVQDAEDSLQSSGLGATSQGTSGQIVVAYGQDIKDLLARNKREAYAKVGLTVLGWIPTTKLLGSAYKGVKLGAGARRMEALAQDGIVSVAERQELGRYLWKLGEVDGAISVYRATTVAGVRAAFRNAALANLKIVGKWAAWTAVLRSTGISIPSRPSSLAPADLAKFAYTQGALILSDKYENPTTRAIKLVGEDAWNYLTRFVARIRGENEGTETSTADAVARVATICEGCGGRPIPPSVVTQLSTTDVINHLEILVDEQGNAQVKFNPRPDLQ
jgi:hypothetical protein